MFIVYGEQATNSLLHFTNNRLVMQRTGRSVISSTACWVSHSFHLRDSTAAVLFLTKCKIVHFVTNSNWDDFCNAHLPSRGWCIPRRVGSDPWYRDMIACGALPFFCRTLRFGFILFRRTKDRTQAKSNCKHVNDLSVNKRSELTGFKLRFKINFI